MRNRKRYISLSLLLGWVSLLSATAQHIHISAGALAPTAGSALQFVNGAGYVTNSGYVINLDLRASGPAIGLYDGGPTFAAAAIDELNGGPEPGHAAPGTRIVAELVSVSGPPGGVFSFWESPNCEDNADQIAFSAAAGETGLTHQFPLSQNNGEPGADPYGHCHGRRYTATKPGLYTLGLRLRDTSTNGPRGGPIHPPSEIAYFHLQAGVAIDGLAFDSKGVTAWFGTKNFGSYTLEKNSVLDDSQPWETVAGPVTGDNHLQSLVDPDPSDRVRFYRLHWETP